MSGQTLVRNKVLNTAQDFDTLREQGIETIRQLSGALWTDHNLHDPGITTLELLCYAITDLGYRTEFPTADLLSGQTGFISEPEKSSFFPAQDVLTSTPLTPLDYRKLLLKIEGIRNAWLQPRLEAPSSELPVYVDTLAGSLSFSTLNAESGSNIPIIVTGLYDVWLELEPHVEWGSMNETALPLNFRGGSFSGKRGQMLFAENTVSNSNAWGRLGSIDNLLNDLSIDVQQFTSRSANIRVTYDEEIFPEVVVQLAELGSLEIAESDWVAMLSSLSFSPLFAFAAKQAEIQRRTGKAVAVLQDNRNLCEDFAAVVTVAADYVAVCSDIEVSPEADLEEVQAQVYFAIEQYLNPPVPFYALSELLSKGLAAETIFNGPYINHELIHDGDRVFDKPGFILDEDLQAAELRSIIHSSDIINELMDIEHVVNIKSLSLRKYSAAGQPMGDAQPWCLAVSSGHQPVLSIANSNILFFKQGVPFVARTDEFEATLRHLRALASKQAYGNLEESLTVPAGRYRDTLSHYPVQHDFPQTYQIGEAGLEASADHQRVTQARQFKGYLMVFEQVLADYLAQLAHLPQLYSIEPDLGQSYFSQFLTGVAPSRGTFADEFYQDAALFSNAAERASLREDREAFFERRHRLLDHLLARFSEKFTDYVMLMMQQGGRSLKTSEELMADKIDFLRQQPVLSRERNKAFNYRPDSPGEVWNSHNVSGLEKRAGRLSGFDDYSRRNLSCTAFFSTLMDTRRVGDDYRVEIKDAANRLLFKSVELFSSRELAMDAARLLYPSISEESAFVVDVNDEDKSIWRIVVGELSLEHDKRYSQENALNVDIEKVRTRIGEVLLEASEETLADESLPQHPLNIIFDTREYGRDYRVEIKDSEQNILFKSKEIFATRQQAVAKARAVFSGVKNPKNYTVDTGGGAGAVFFTLVFGGVELTHDVMFDTANDAVHAIEEVVARYFQVLLSEACDSEGMYLIEHILLRPRNASSTFPDICINQDHGACTDEDPYSFRASVVLPYWPTRFQNLAFRNFFENLIREQAPAHVHLKICWVDHLQMVEVEKALNTWLQALRNEEFNSNLLAAAQNQLLVILEQLKSIYPTATLHDCEDDDSGTPVRLGSTNLGVF